MQSYSHGKSAHPHRHFESFWLITSLLRLKSEAAFDIMYGLQSQCANKNNYSVTCPTNKYGKRLGEM